VVILGVEFDVNVLYCTAPEKAIKTYEDRVIYLAWHDLDLVSDTLAVCKYCITCVPIQQQASIPSYPIQLPSQP
jgi:hypothetical protein